MIDMPQTEKYICDQTYLKSAIDSKMDLISFENKQIEEFDIILNMSEQQ